MDELGISLARPAPLADEGAWRVLLRVQRSTLASAVLVVRRHDGRVLALASTSGELRLPLKELDGWKAVPRKLRSGSTSWWSKGKPRI